MRDYTITIGGVDYAGQTVSAKRQFEALHIAMRTKLITALNGEMSDMGMVGIFAAMDYSDIDKLEKLVVRDHIKRADDGVPVAENLFQDEPQNYYLLIAKACEENVGNFWQLRRQTGKPEAAESKG